jgi:hypothetical protein
MRQTAAVLCVLLMLTVSMGCGNSKVIDGERHDTVGVFTLDERDPDVCYTVIVGNVVWSVLLIESVVFPVYFVGFSILEPTDKDFCHEHPDRHTRGTEETHRE